MGAMAFRIHVPASPLLQQHRPSHHAHHACRQQPPSALLAPACRASDAQQAAGEQPWKLMGRVVTEESIQFSQQQKQALISSAAATASGLPPEEFDARLQASSPLPARPGSTPLAAERSPRRVSPRV